SAAKIMGAYIPDGEAGKRYFFSPRDAPQRSVPRRRSPQEAENRRAAGARAVGRNLDPHMEDGRLGPSLPLEAGVQAVESGDRGRDRASRRQMRRLLRIAAD